MWMKLTSRNFLRCAAALCMLMMSSCGSEVPFPRCVSADNFNSNTTVAVSAYYSDANTNAFIANNGELGDGTSPGATTQVVRWQDTGLVTDGNEIVVKVQGAWVPWDKYGNKKSSPIAVNTGLVRPADLSNEFYDSVVDVDRVCSYTKYSKRVGSCDLQCSKIPERDNKGGSTANEIGRPCWLEHGYGAYLLFQKPGDEDPNATLELMQFPESPTTHLAYDSADNAGSGSYSSSGKIYGSDCGIVSVQKGWKIYVKILDNYYHDNAGGYSLEFTKGVVSAAATDIFEYVRKLVREELDASGKKIFENITKNQAFKNFIFAVITLFLVVTALTYVLGMVRTPLPDLIIRTLKMVLVLLLISPSSWDFFYNHLLQLFINGVDEIIALINSYSIGQQFDADKPFAFMDIMIRDRIFAPVVWEAKARALITADWSSIFALLIIIIAVLFYIGLCLYGFVIYLTGFVAITFLVGLMPLLFVGILFPRFRSLFDGWLTQCISFSMQAILMFTLIGMFSTLIMHYYYRIFGFTACYNEWIHLKLKYIVDQKYSEWTPGQKYDTIKIGWSGIEDREYPASGTTARYTFTGGGSVIKVPPDYKEYDFRYIDYPFLDPDTESNTVPGGVVLSADAAKRDRVEGIDKVALLTNSLIAAERKPAIERLLLGIDKEFESIQGASGGSTGKLDPKSLSEFKKKIQDAKAQTSSGTLSDAALKKELIDLLTGKILVGHTTPGTPMEKLEKQYDYNIIKNIKQGWIVMWSEVFGLILMAFLVWQMRAFVQHLGVVLAGGGMMSRTIASMYGEGFTRIFASAPVIGRVVDSIDRGIDGVRMIARDRISSVSSAVSRLPEKAVGKIPGVGGALSSVIAGTRHVAGGLMSANTEEDIYTMKSVSPRLDYARAWVGAHLGRSPLDALKYVGSYAAARATGSTSGSLAHNFKQDRAALLQNIRTLTMGVDKHKPGVYVPKRSFGESENSPFRRPDDTRGMVQQGERAPELFDDGGNLQVNRENFWQAMDAMHALNVMRREADSDIAQAAIDRDIDRLRDEIRNVQEQRPGEIAELREYVRPSGEIDFAALEARAVEMRAAAGVTGLPPRELDVDGFHASTEASAEGSATRIREMEETGRIISDASIQGFGDTSQLDRARDRETESVQSSAERDLASRQIAASSYEDPARASSDADMGLEPVSQPRPEGVDAAHLRGGVEESVQHPDTMQVAEGQYGDDGLQARSQPEDLLHDADTGIVSDGHSNVAPDSGDAAKEHAVSYGGGLAEEHTGHATDQASVDEVPGDEIARRGNTSQTMDDAIVQEGDTLPAAGEPVAHSDDVTTSVESDPYVSSADRVESEQEVVPGKETVPQVEDLLSDIDAQGATADLRGDEERRAEDVDDAVTPAASSIDGELSTERVDSAVVVAEDNVELEAAAADPEMQVEQSTEPPVEDLLADVKARDEAVADIIGSEEQRLEGADEESGRMGDTIGDEAASFMQDVEHVGSEPSADPAEPEGTAEHEGDSPVNDLLAEVESQDEVPEHESSEEQASKDVGSALMPEEVSADDNPSLVHEGPTEIVPGGGVEPESTAAEPEGPVEQGTEPPVQDLLTEVEEKNEADDFGGTEQVLEDKGEASEKTEETAGNGLASPEDREHVGSEPSADAAEPESAEERVDSPVDNPLAEVESNGVPEHGGSEKQVPEDDHDAAGSAVGDEEISLEREDHIAVDRDGDVEEPEIAAEKETGPSVYDLMSDVEKKAVSSEASGAEERVSEDASEALSQTGDDQPTEHENYGAVENAAYSSVDDSKLKADKAELTSEQSQEQLSDFQEEAGALATPEAAAGKEQADSRVDAEQEESPFTDIGHSDVSDSFEDLLSDPISSKGAGDDCDVSPDQEKLVQYGSDAEKEEGVSVAEQAGHVVDSGGHATVSHAEEHQDVRGVYVDVSKKKDEELEHAWSGDEHAESSDKVEEKTFVASDDVSAESQTAVGSDLPSGGLSQEASDQKMETHSDAASDFAATRDVEQDDRKEEVSSLHHEHDEEGQVGATAEEGGILSYVEDAHTNRESGDEIAAEGVVFGTKMGSETGHDSSSGQGDARSERDEEAGIASGIPEYEQGQHSGHILPTRSGDIGEDGAQVSGKPVMVSVSGGEDAEETKKRRQRRKKRESDDKDRNTKEPEASVDSVAEEPASGTALDATDLMETATAAEKFAAFGVTSQIMGLSSEQSAREKKAQSNRENIARMKNEISNLRSRIVSENLTEQELHEIEQKIKEIEGKIGELDSDS